MRATHLRVCLGSLNLVLYIVCACEHLVVVWGNSSCGCQLWKKHSFLKAHVGEREDSMSQTTASHGINRLFVAMWVFEQIDQIPGGFSSVCELSLDDSTS